MIKSPVLILAGEDDPVCPVEVAEDLARRLPADTTRLVRLPNARHHIFRDRPDLAFPVIEDFVNQRTRRLAGDLTTTRAPVLAVRAHEQMIMNPDIRHRRNSRTTVVSSGILVPTDKITGFGRGRPARDTLSLLAHQWIHPRARRQAT